MNITMTFKLNWDKKGGEKIADFKKKYDSFKLHVLKMQASGALPMGEIYWVIGRVHEEPLVWQDKVIDVTPIHVNGDVLP